MMNRRNTLKSLLGAAGAGAALNSLPMKVMMRPASAQTAPTAGKTLIYLSAAGGMCSIQGVPPVNDPFYEELRPDTHWDPPGTGDRPAVALPGAEVHAFHPGFEPLVDIWMNGDLAVFPACSWEHVSGSHFDAQIRMQTGFRSENDDGFMNRYMELNPPAGILPAAQIGNRTQHMLSAGDTDVPAIRDARSINSLDDGAFCANESGACGENRLFDQMSRMYDADIVTPFASRAQIHGQADILIETYRALEAIDEDYTPDGGGVYSDGLGRDLSLMAQILKTGLRPSFMTTITGGPFDTHNMLMSTGNQRGFNRIGANVRTFYDDVGPDILQDVIVVIGSEFGRTARQNGNMGSDHGVGGLWMAMSRGAVNGGIYGVWPTLDPEIVDERSGFQGDGFVHHRRNTLAYSMDQRDIWWQVFQTHIGASVADMQQLWPGHTPTTDPNLMFMSGVSV